MVLFKRRPASDLCELLSGQRRGLRAALLRGLLSLGELPYRVVVGWRNWRHDRSASKSQKVAVPVVSVGNLTVGGTGKTPMVALLARWYRRRGVRVAVVSRGYGAEEGQRNDEAMELELRLPDVPQMQNPDRVAGAQAAIEEFQCQLVLLDDGFQHRRLRRDLDIVLLDATEPFGFGHLLPRGLLREPVSSLRRAHVVVLSRADAIEPARREEIRARVRRYAPNAVWVEASHAPEALVNSAGEARPPADVRGKRVLAFCGIGNPGAFRSTLQSLGAEVAAFREFPDHHAYVREDIAALAQAARECSADLAVCTRKDFVKIRADRLGNATLWALQIDLSITTGQAGLEALLVKHVPAANNGSRESNTIQANSSPSREVPS
ncbi:MAG: tetraacyldisaccharide 4'-kinase [Planctomycetia bacterium]|nr:tetraacyldisaccharide 4'-kinase [Planctomycetia bacterium]